MLRLVEEVFHTTDNVALLLLLLLLLLVWGRVGDPGMHAGRGGGCG